MNETGLKVCRALRESFNFETEHSDFVRASDLAQTLSMEEQECQSVLESLVSLGYVERYQISTGNEASYTLRFEGFEFIGSPVHSTKVVVKLFPFPNIDAARIEIELSPVRLDQTGDTRELKELIAVFVKHHLYDSQVSNAVD